MAIPKETARSDYIIGLFPFPRPGGDLLRRLELITIRNYHIPTFGKKGIALVGSVLGL